MSLPVFRRVSQNPEAHEEKSPARPSLKVAEIGRLTRADAGSCGASTEEIDQMLRKIVIGLVTVASLSATVLAPTEASARAFGGKGFGRGGGFGGHHFAGGGFGGHRHGGMGVGLGLGLGLELIGAAANSGCRTGVTASGRTVTVC
jgi:hypothetical protein